MDKSTIADIMRRFSISKASAINDNMVHKDIALLNAGPYSRPTHVTLNLSTKCNYNCPICSINKAKKLFPKYHNNMISKETVERMHSFFDYSQSVSFMGLLGEPLLNPDFFNIVDYFRKNTTASLAVSTNGLLLTKENRDNFISSSFENLTFSLHAASEHVYEKLQAGKFKRTVDNLKSLIQERNSKKQIYPKLSVVHAINWWNIHELPIFMDLMKEAAPDSVYIYHYHDYQGIKDNISLKNGDAQLANQLINSAYDYAKKIGIHEIISPQDPPVITAQVKKTDVIFNDKISCDLPWRGLQMRGCITHADSHYVGCCNVFNIFRLNYKEFKEPFRNVWHHPVLKYIRETLRDETSNPLCRYCKSPERAYLKATDNKKNNDRKAMALAEFYNAFNARFGDVSQFDSKGLTALKEDPADIRLE